MMPSDRVEEAVLIEAPGMDQSIDQVLREAPVDQRLKRVAGDARRRALAQSAVAWTASGTATLECALLDVPMVVGYRLKPLSFALAKLLVRVPNVALVNLIAGETLAPELLQGDWNPRALGEVAGRILDDGGADQRAGLQRVRERLGLPGASRKAAAAVSEYFAS
jgi:lipid-A-disaccharide synthase